MTFDGANKRIVLTSTSVTASEIWSRYIDWLVTDSNNARWGQAMTQIGGDDLGSGLFVPIYIFLQNGWRVRPMESNHQLTITGNLFVAEGGSPLVNTLGSYNVIAQYTVPVQAQAFASGGSGGLTTEQAGKLDTITNNTGLIPALL